MEKSGRPHWIWRIRRFVLACASAMTSRQFITSPRQMTCSMCMSASTSSLSIAAPAVSSASFVEGTEEGMAIRTSTGPSCALCISARIPSTPKTFAISCGSAISVVTPQRTAAFINVRGAHIVLSMCIWQSISPGTTYCPPRSTERRGVSGSSSMPT